MKMRKSKRTLRAAAALFALLLTLAAAAPSAVFAGGDTSAAAIQKLEDRLASLKQQQDAVRREIASAKDNISDTVAFKQQLDEQLRMKTEEIALKQELIEEYRAEIADAENRIAALQSENADKYEIFKTRMRIAYEEGSVTYLEMLLSSTDFTDFLLSVERIGSMLDYEKNVMEELEYQESETRDAKNRIELNQAKAEAQQQELENDKAQLEEQIESANNYINNLNNLIAQNEQKQKELIASENALDKEIENALIARQAQLNAQYEAQQRAAEEAARKAAAAGKKNKYSTTGSTGGTLLWPVDASHKKISSAYGYRSIWGGTSFHRGIDIPISYGDPVYAAAGGTVVTSTYHYSYGYYVVIDHGSGLATLYAHNSRLLVAAGDIVKGGQQIAQGGSTGSSTGNHCHFEIRINGATQNPLDSGNTWYVVQPK